MNTVTPPYLTGVNADTALQRSMPGTLPSPLNIQASAVSWGAIAAGASAAAALSLILLILGVGLGFSAVSPWSQKGIGAGGLGLSTILWITFTQLFASGLGGYLAGRLRTRWQGVQHDEVYFRDTAHGFLAWAIASLSTAALLTSVIGSITGAGLQAAATVTAGAATAGASVMASDLPKPDTDSAGSGYFMDSLFRVAPGPVAGTSNSSGVSDSAGLQQQGGSRQVAELTRIFMNTVRTGPLPAEDLTYAAQVVAQLTGLSQQEAEKRVVEVYARMQSRLAAAQTAARETADKARKASAYAALWLFVSLLVGAFVASWSATYGGRQRDI